MIDERQNNPTLKRFRAALNEMYGDRLERVVLYGSRARGDAHEGSDYDVAVFLRDTPDRIAELYRLADLSTKIIVEEDGPFIHAMALSSRLLQRSVHAADVCHSRRGHRFVRSRATPSWKKPARFSRKPKTCSTRTIGRMKRDVRPILLACMARRR